MHLDVKKVVIDFGEILWRNTASEIEGSKLKFHALLAKTSKNSQFAKKRLFYPLSIVRGHLKIVPCYSAFQIRKSQEIPEFYLQR